MRPTGTWAAFTISLNAHAARREIARVRVCVYEYVCLREMYSFGDFICIQFQYCEMYMRLSIL